MPSDFSAARASHRKSSKKNPQHPSKSYALTPWLVRRLSSWIVLSTVLTVGVAQIARATTRTFDGGTSGTGTALDTAANWSADTLPTGSDEAVFDTSITLPGSLSLSTASATTYGDLIWNSNVSSTIGVSGNTNRVITLSGGGGSTAAVADGGASGDLLLMGTNATSNTLTIGGNVSSGTGQLSLAISKLGNIDVVNAGATLNLTAALSGAFGVTKTGLGTLVLAGANTFGGTANNFTISAGTVQISGVGTLGSKFTDLVVNANLDLNGTTQNVDALSGSSTGSIYNNANGTTATLIIGNDNGGGTFSGVISNNTNSGTGTVGLTKIGTATETINSTQTYSGATTVNVGYIGNTAGTGTLALSTNAGQLLNSDVTINGATFTVTSSAAGTITRAKSLTLNNATFTVTGNSTGNSVESVTNALALGGGRSTVTLVPSVARNAQFTAASLVRSPGATVFVRGTNLGLNSVASATVNATNITFATAPTLSGSGAAGTAMVGIIPWAYGDNSTSGSGTDFLTYDSTFGLRRLTSSEYVTTFASGNSTLVNAKITSVIGAINSTTVLNSLTLGTLGRINGTGTLTVSSGGILAVDNSSIGTIDAGTLDFGTAEGILLPISGKTLSIGSTITGSGGLTAGGAGTAVLTGTNAYTGGTYLSGGVLNINGDAALGAVPGAPATNLTFSGGMLQAGAANVTISSNRNIATTVTGVNAGFDTNGNTMSIAGSINGIGGINKLGNGVLTLSGTNGYTGQTFATRGTLNVTGSLTGTSSLVFLGGGIKLDFSGANAPATNIVNSAASLAFNIGPTGVAGVNTLTIQGKDNAASAQTFGGGTDFSNFASHIVLTPGAGTGTLTVNLGTIVRATPTTNATTASFPVGATLDITIPSGVTVQGSNATTNGIIVGATVNANTWATVSGSNIVGLSSYSSSFSTANGNLDMTTSGTATVDLGTVRFNTAAANTLTLGGTNGGLRELTGGGVLVTSNVGANLSLITGGILQGLSRRDVIFIQNNTAGDLEVDSIITDLGGIGNNGITKSGAGRLILTANNTINGPTAINEGTIVVTGNYVAPVSPTGTVANGGTQITGISDMTGIYVGEKVTNATAMNSPGVSTTWVVTAIDTVNNTVTVSTGASAAVTGGTFTFSGGGGLGASTSAVSIAQGATLQIGNGTASGNLFLGQSISSSGSVIFDRSDAFTYSNLISGIGSVTQEGSSPLTLTGANTYTGATIVLPNSILIAGNTSAFGSNSAANVAATGTLELGGKSITLGSISGAGNIENDSATGVTLTIGGDNTSTTFSGALNDGISSPAMNVTKIGTGTQTLSGANTFTGTYSANGGTTNISGHMASVILAGGALNTTGVINILPGASISANVNGLLNSISAGVGGTSLGAIYQSGGDVAFNAEFVLAAGTGAYGFYDMTGGTITASTDSAAGPNERFRLGGAANNSVAVFYQSGGTISLPSSGSANFEVGGNAGGPITGASAVGYFTGGALTTGLANHIGVDGSTGAIRGEETIAGTALVTVNGVATLGQTSGDVGILNLDGGIYAVRQIVKGTSGTGWVNFNGGTLRAATSATGASFFSGLSRVTVYSGGGTIDTNGQNITIAQPLLAPTGNGVTTIPVSYGGVGYIGAPYISITGGGGTGATAVANMIDDGSGNGTYKIASITITNPGIGYTSTPTVTIAGGGGNGAVLGAATTALSASGGIVKTGAGTLTLSGANTYTGVTQVMQGTLLISGSLTGSVDAGNGTTAGGTGTIKGATIESGATLLGGNTTTANGTLTSSSDVSLADNSVIQLTLGSSGAHSSLARTGGSWVFDSNQAFSFNLVGAAPGTYDNIITGLTGSEPGLATINTWTILTPGVVGTFSLDASDNIDLTISAIPEPSALAGMLAGFGTLVGLRRLRRRRS